MRHLMLIALCALCAWQVQSQEEDESYQMYELIELSAVNGHQKQLHDALMAHNDQFHQEGTERVNVWAVMSGSRAGNMIWTKGPLMWSDLDNEIEGDEHMDNWYNDVMQHANMEGIEFWRHWQGLHYMPEDFNPKVLVLRTFKVHEQKWNNIEHTWKPMIDLVEELEWADEGVRVYWNAAPAADERDLTIVWYYENWAAMDQDREFFKSMEEKYEIDRREFFENWTEMTDFKGMEIWTLIDDLSVAGSDE